MRETNEYIHKQSEMRQLLRTLKTSLELAIVGRAPTDLLNRLGRVAGLLDAVSHLPIDEGPAQAMAAGLVTDGLAAIDTWQKWQRARTPAA